MKFDDSGSWLTALKDGPSPLLTWNLGNPYPCAIRGTEATPIQDEWCSKAIRVPGSPPRAGPSQAKQRFTTKGWCVFSM